MNARRTPGRVLGDHAEDELAEFHADALSARAPPVPREPGPIQLEAGALPSHNCIRLNENPCMPPPGPEPSQYHPEKSVGSSKPRTGMSPFQNSKLLTESQILQEEIAARTKESDNRNSQKPQEAQHQGSMARGQPRPIQAHLHDSTEELYFGERQLLIPYRKFQGLQTLAFPRIFSLVVDISYLA